MRRRRPHGLVAVAFVALLVLAAAAGVAACSSSGGGGGQKSQTPEQRFAAILGHQPSGLAATIAQRGTLVVGEDPEFAPQSSVDSTGVWSGFDVDVARAVGAVLGLQVEFRQLDWARVPAALAADRYDVAISSMATDPAPVRGLAFAAPYAYMTAQVVVRQGDSAVTTLGELRGKTIGVGASTTFQQFLEAAGGINVELYSSDADALPDLANGSTWRRHDGRLDGRHPTAGGRPDRAAGAGFFYQPQAFATRRGEADFVKVLDGALKTMRRNGTLAALSRKWYHGLDVERAAGRGRAPFQQGAGHAEGRDVPAAVAGCPELRAAPGCVRAVPFV